MHGQKNMKLYNYLVRELLVIHTVYTEGTDFNLSQQRCSRYKSSGICHSDMG